MQVHGVPTDEDRAAYPCLTLDCPKMSLQLAFQRIRSKIFAEGHAAAWVFEDDILLHDNFTTLFPRWAPALNVKSPGRRPGWSYVPIPRLSLGPYVGMAVRVGTYTPSNEPPLLPCAPNYTST